MLFDVLMVILIGFVDLICACVCVIVVGMVIDLVRDENTLSAIFSGLLAIIQIALTVFLIGATISNSHLCNKCHTFTFGTEYCPICGERFENTEVECSVCHAENDSNSKFCRKCGGFLGENGN